MKFESMDGFEQELSQAFARRPAPPGLKHKIMARKQHPRKHAIPWQRLAAVVVLSVLLGGGVVWHQREEQQRKGEAVRQQVFTALRITNHALDQMNSQLAAHEAAQK